MTFNSFPMNIKTLSPKELFPAISAFYSKAIFRTFSNPTWLIFYIS